MICGVHYRSSSFLHASDFIQTEAQNKTKSREFLVISMHTYFFRFFFFVSSFENFNQIIAHAFKAIPPSLSTCSIHMPCSVGIYTNVYVYACIFMCASCWSLFVSLYLSNILRNCNRNTLCIAWRTTKMCVLFAFKMATGFLLVSSIFLFRSFTCTSSLFFYFASNELASIFNVKVFHFDSDFLTITFFLEMPSFALEIIIFDAFQKR